MRNLTISVFMIIVAFGCKKKDASSCEAISVETEVQPSTPAFASGIITINASGSSTFTYSLNGGDFQENNIFDSLAAGDYSIRVRDQNNCEKSSAVKVGTSSTATTKNIVGIFRIIKVTSITGTGPETDITNTLQPCEKDDQYKFNGDMTYNYQDVGLVCTIPGSFNGTWSLPSSNSINFDNIELWTIRFYDGADLQLSLSNSITTTVVYFRRQ